MNRRLTAVCTALLACFCLADTYQLNAEQMLTKHLINAHKRAGLHARPVDNARDGLNVTFGLGLINIMNFNVAGDNEASIKVKIWRRYTWNNAVLRWDPEYFDGLSEVRLPVGSMWTPDIVLYNGLALASAEDKDALVVVSKSGNVLWIPPTIDRVPCSRDEANNQWACTFKFGSWVYDESHLNVNFYDGLADFDVNDFQESSKVEVVSHSGVRNAKKYACCPETYVDLTFTLNVRQRL